MTKYNGYECETGKRRDLEWSQDGSEYLICKNGYCRSYLESGYSAEYFCQGCSHLDSEPEESE